MTLRPSDDLPSGPGAGTSASDPFEVDGVPAMEAMEEVSTADDSDGLEEDPELQANRTDVEGSPTGHS